MNYTDCFIEGLYSMTQNKLPSNIEIIAKKCFIDYLGVALAGARELSEKEDAFLNSKNGEEHMSTIIGVQVDKVNK